MRLSVDDCGWLYCLGAPKWLRELIVLTKLWESFARQIEQCRFLEEPTVRELDHLAPFKENLRPEGS